MRMRAVVIGAGAVGCGHRAVLTAAEASVITVDRRPLRGVDETCLDTAIARHAPHVVVVAIPPGPAVLECARAAAARGAVVVVEKPAVLGPVGPIGLRDHGDLFVACETHFDRVATQLLTHRPTPSYAELLLRCGRVPHGWRAERSTGGGILRHQAWQSLALLARLWPEPPHSGTVTLDQRRGAGVEEAVNAVVAWRDERALVLSAQTRAPGTLRHRLSLHASDKWWDLDFSAGLGAAQQRQRWLRSRMYTALAHYITTGERHPSLLPWREHERALELCQWIHAHAVVNELGRVPLAEVTELAAAPPHCRPQWTDVATASKSGGSLSGSSAARG